MAIDHDCRCHEIERLIHELHSSGDKLETDLKWHDRKLDGATKEVFENRMSTEATGCLVAWMMLMNVATIILLVCVLMRVKAGS